MKGDAMAAKRGWARMFQFWRRGTKSSTEATSTEATSTEEAAAAADEFHMADVERFVEKLLEGDG